MTKEQFALICQWDKRCGDNEGTMFGTTIDRRRLIEYVKELEAEIAEDNEERGSWHKIELAYRKRIEALEAENARLREAINHYVSRTTIGSPYGADGLKGAVAHHEHYKAYFEQALAQGTKTPEVKLP